jgi:hypothetical protein
MALTVEVVYALADREDLSTIRLSDGATLRDAILACGILDRHAEIRIENQKFGIFGKPASLDARLADGDRVEIYRPLAADPKEARRTRAAAGRRKKTRV